jgi:hypothetical protein
MDEDLYLDKKFMDRRKIAGFYVEIPTALSRRKPPDILTELSPLNLLLSDVFGSK